jgi:DNA-binding IclR family transcriptional regulator
MNANTANLTSQTVERALGILMCFSDSQPQQRVSELAGASGLPQSTVSRLMKTLEALGFVEQHDSGMYQLGPEVIRLAGVALNQIPLRNEAMVELSNTAAEIGLAANLAVLRKDALFYLGSAEGPKAPKHFTMIGRRGPLHCTGMGKVLLAWLDVGSRAEILDRIEYTRYTPHTIDNKSDLMQELEEARQRGYAIEREELAFGRACIAAPIYDAAGRVIAATSISGPLRALDLDTNERDLAQRILELADRISQRMGKVSVTSAAM